MSDLRKKVLEFSKKYNLSHVGSNLSAVDILDEIFAKALHPDHIVVSSGHAGIAYFLCMEKWFLADAEQLFKEHGIHAPMYGSLGHGLGIAVGKALANPLVDIYCLTSDGEWMEGSMWEALRIAEQLELKNLKIYVNANGYGGLGGINSRNLEKKLKAFSNSGMIDFRYTDTKPLTGLKAHYEKV